MKPTHAGYIGWGEGKSAAEWRRTPYSLQQPQLATEKNID
jgi:hypothetical protein